jgi:hypothetical protein
MESFSLPCSQDVAAEYYPETPESDPRNIQFLKIHSSIILRFNLMSRLLVNYYKIATYARIRDA